jgi:uncharacterized membrane protein YczE
MNESIAIAIVAVIAFFIGVLDALRKGKTNVDSRFIVVSIVTMLLAIQVAIWEIVR